MSDARKRKKSYYFHAKRQCGSRQMLDAGLKGFLITCNRNEKQTVREAYNLLNEYSCKLYEEESAVKSVDNNDASTEVDFNQAILNQVEALQGGDNISGERRFQAVDTKTSNCIFVKTTLDHPDEIVTKLLTDVLNSGRTKSRSILKIFPVLGTCRAVEDKIGKLVEDLVSSYFADRPLQTFAIIYKVRCNNLSRDVILPVVGKAVAKVCPLSMVDLTNPDYVISVDVLTKFACISIMKDFNTLKKYNLQELVNLKVPCCGSGISEPTQLVQSKSANCDKSLCDDEDSKCHKSDIAASDASSSDMTLTKEGACMEFEGTGY